MINQGGMDKLCLSVLNLKGRNKIKRHKLIGLLLLGAFIFTMGFNVPAFATSKLNVTKLFNTLDEIKAQIQNHDDGGTTDHTNLLNELNGIKAQIQTHDDGDTTDHTNLLNKLNEIQTPLEDIDAATSEACPDSWKKVLPASERFELVMNDEAVLDKETCLVWERSPSATPMDWYGAIFYCYDKVVGGRGGWRLPTVEELMSLVDRTQGPPTLPAGHLFLNVQSSFYWSATTSADGTSDAWGVDFGFGDVGGDDKSYDDYVWCVRGGHGYDGGHNHD